MEHSEKNYRKYIIETFPLALPPARPVYSWLSPMKKKIKDIFQKNNCCLDSENPT